jgi:hypothetical protein
MGAIRLGREGPARTMQYTHLKLCSNGIANYVGCDHLDSQQTTETAKTLLAKGDANLSKPSCGPVMGVNQFGDQEWVNNTVSFRVEERHRRSSADRRLHRHRPTDQLGGAS